jgi:hypothetical protein
MRPIAVSLIALALDWCALWRVAAQDLIGASSGGRYGGSVRLGSWLIATIAALVLGLLICLGE